MIRINLLPFRLARKKENIRRQVSIFLLSIALIIVALVWVTLSVESKISQTKNRIESVKAESLKYKKQADRVTAIKKKLKILNDKLNIVASLKTRKDEQQILLEELADRVVKTRMWLSSIDADRNKVVLKGVAFDNPTIADFMRNLEQSPLFGVVDLKRSKVKNYAGGVSLKEFEISCSKKQPASAKTSQKGKEPNKGKK
ncbi:MAG: PilN domain-containing protein [Desulfobacterales bacterium]|nr:PilN domain-containing protein [Desulfobacterales bacterium]